MHGPGIALIAMLCHKFEVVDAVACHAGEWAEQEL